MKIKAYAKWIFPDVLPEDGITAEFVEQKEYEKGGEVFWFLGSIGDFVGDLRIFPSKIENLKDIIRQLGDDDSAWKCKRMQLKPNKEKTKVIATVLV